MPARPRVLVLAESAHPEAQSVSWIGWALSRALTAVADVHLVTRRTNRDAILAAGLVEGRDFRAIDTDAYEQAIGRVAGWLRGGSDKGWTTLMAMSLPAYYAFERAAWQELGPALRSRQFDLVHRITPVSPTMPSLMARHCRGLGVPFVLGPLNGGLPWPRQFNALRHAEREWLSYFREAYRLMPAYRSTREAASAILVGSRETQRQIPRRWQSKCINMPENGIDPSRFPPAPPRLREQPLKAVFVGRLVPYKGADMAIEAAAALLHDGRMRLDIVGDGPELPRLQALVEAERLTASVRLHGRVSPEAVHEHLAQADILLFPSIREFGGGVVLEAMAMGAVPVVVDYGGPGELVTDTSGIRIPLGDRDAIVARLRHELAQLTAGGSRLDSMSAAGQLRVSELFTWEQKARQVREVYAWVLGERPDRPAFPFTTESPAFSRPQ